MLVVENFFNFGLELGYLGIVLFSFISSVMVFIPIPYFPVLMSAALNKNFDPTLIVLFSTIGAVAGKMIIFCGSYYGRKIILSYSTKKRMLCSVVFRVILHLLQTDLLKSSLFCEKGQDFARTAAGEILLI